MVASLETELAAQQTQINVPVKRLTALEQMLYLPIKTYRIRMENGRADWI